MRAKEFINEGREGSLEDDVAEALPAAYVIPDLPNQDAYKQYRFGLALAGARSVKQRKEEGFNDFSTASKWGENAIVVSYSNTTHQIIDQALKDVGLSPSSKKQITSHGSNEVKDVNKQSPVAQPKRNKYGV